MNSNDPIKRVHFVGVGGIGMSGIALVAHNRGIEVSGSDLKESRISRSLVAAGIEVHIGHIAANLGDENPDIVVISSAVPSTNPEVVEARERGIAIWPRAKMLALLGKGSKTLGVAGTHGKTTTSSMLATTLARLEADPTFLVGGTVDGYNTNAVSGDGEYFVVEADESDGSFVYLDPYVALITNIEEDHLDHYADIQEIEAAFSDFMGSVDPEGAIIICGEDPHIVELAKKANRRVFSYGLGSDCDARCIPVEMTGGKTVFDVALPDSTTARISLGSNPGIHNALNATSVLVTLWFLGFDAQAAAEALSGFSGVRRRFDRIGIARGVEVVDDYGHHPTEVKATIEAASTLGYKRIHVLFQPHRYTRTEALAKQWGEAFDKADTVTFMDVYSAGEVPIPGISGKTLVDSVLSHNPRAVVGWMPHRNDIIPYLTSRVHEGDLVLTMGAGDVTTLAPLIIEELSKGEAVCECV
ncbi:MAG: UDP-N-acetylmuramate--L-alanine ligase [Actinobacteria bacterium]|nr:UDP-N-acetylmuramate--L-alanine ligase [Actinomycetota bacterium]